MFTDNPAGGTEYQNFSADDEYKLDSPFFPPQNAICSSAVSFLAFTGGMDQSDFFSLPILLPCGGSPANLFMPRSCNLVPRDF
jgi:hypothetical protein